MVKRFRFLLGFSLLAAIVFITGYRANASEIRFEGRVNLKKSGLFAIDTIPPSNVMEIVTKAIYALNSFNIAAVSDLYTPNAVIADDEAPYSWNGPTAGVQWVNAVEKVCKDNHLNKLKGVIEPINVFQRSGDDFYIVVPVSFTGNLPDKQRFSVKGAFTFVLRQENGKWLIKSQAWLQKKAITGE